MKLSNFFKKIHWRLHVVRSAWFKTGLILAILVSFHFYNWATHMLHMFNQLENRSLLFWSYCGVYKHVFYNCILLYKLDIVYIPLSEDFSPTSVVIHLKEELLNLQISSFKLRTAFTSLSTWAWLQLISCTIAQPMPFTTLTSQSSNFKKFSFTDIVLRKT